MMPVARRVLNAFTARELSNITGLSLPMVDYLLREGLLRPSYGEGGAQRGKVRYYSYRDLVIARLIQGLREGGVQLRRLKTAVEILSGDAPWVEEGDPSKRLNYLISDGREVFLRNTDGFLETLTGTGQRAFAFVVNIRNLEAEVRDRLPKAQQAFFTVENKDLIFDESPVPAATIG